MVKFGLKQRKFSKIAPLLKCQNRWELRSLWQIKESCPETLLNDLLSFTKGIRWSNLDPNSENWAKLLHFPKPAYGANMSPSLRALKPMANKRVQSRKSSQWFAFIYIRYKVVKFGLNQRKLSVIASIYLACLRGWNVNIVESSETYGKLKGPVQKLFSMICFQ